MRIPVPTLFVGALSDLCVDEGDLVVTGQMVCQVESMKTMFPLYAPQGGRVFYVTELGEIVAEGDTIFEVEVE